MTHLHRVGLAGLYMTLARLDPSKYAESGKWELEPTRIHLRWHDTPRDFFAPLLTEAFGISPQAPFSSQPTGVTPWDRPSGYW